MRALAVGAALVTVVAAVLAWRARPRVESVPPLTVPPAATAGSSFGPGRAEAARPGDPAPTAEGVVVVAVSGRVRRPGLVRLPTGARVADALNGAGGALPGTDVSLLNLARKVVDGELIVVGVNGPAPTAPGSPAAGPDAPAAKLNLNTATLAELDALPGVGPVLAQRILDQRTQRGGFRAVTDLRQVDGIGPARFEDLKDRVTV